MFAPSQADVRRFFCHAWAKSRTGQPMDAIGHEVVRLLLDILKGRATTLQQVTLPHRLVVRASTAAPAAG